MPKLKGKNPVLIPNSLSILLIYKPSNFLGPLQTMRQEYFSKEKRFNTFFINLIYNKGEGGNLLKQSLLNSINKKKTLQAAVVRTKSFPQFFSHCL